MTQGSSEEVEDIKKAYAETNGSIGEIMDHIPHSTHEDEARFIILITDLISKSELPSLPAWESSVKDEKSRLVRQKQGEKEAKEAEKLAKELGVWDEFYGSGKKSARKGKGKGKQEKNDEGDAEEDTSALQALILKKKKKLDGFYDSLAAKYAEPDTGKGKKRAKDDDAEDESPKKKKSKRAPAPPEIDDEEFEKLQQQLFGDKAKTAAPAKAKAGRSSRSRKTK